MATNSHGWLNTNEATLQVVSHHNSFGVCLRRPTTTQVTFGQNVL